MGVSVARSKPEPCPAEPLPAVVPLVLPAPRPSRPVIFQRFFTSLLVNIVWRVIVLLILVTAGGGLVYALVQPNGSAEPLVTGRFVDMRRFGDGALYVSGGWAEAGADGRATRGVVSGLTLPLEPAETQPHALSVFAEPRFAPGEDKFWVDLLVDGTIAGRWVFDRDEGARRWVEAAIPAKNTEGALRITFVVGSADPSEAGAGLMVEAFRLKP